MTLQNRSKGFTCWQQYISHIAVKLNLLCNSKTAVNTTLSRYPPYFSQHIQKTIGPWTVLWQLQVHSWCHTVTCHMQSWLQQPNSTAHHAWRWSVQQWSFTTGHLLKNSDVKNDQHADLALNVAYAQQEQVFTSRWLYDLRCQETAFPTPVCHLLPALWKCARAKYWIKRNIAPSWRDGTDRRALYRSDRSLLGWVINPNL